VKKKVSTDSAPKAEPGVYPYRCHAEGCPLNATIFPTVIGPPISGVCRYHDAAKPSQWRALTQILTSGPFTEEIMAPQLLQLGLRWNEPSDFRRPSVIPPAKPRPAVWYDDPEWAEERAAIQAESRGD
jgi:hypothetical protein